MEKRYCRKRHPTEAVFWKAMLSVREQVEEHLIWDIREGNISFWYDSWLPSGKLELIAGDWNWKDSMALESLFEMLTETV